MLNVYIILQLGVLLAWFAVIRGQFSQICFSRRGCVGPLCHLQRKLGHLLPQIRIPRILGTTTEAPRWTTRKINYYRRAQRLKWLELIQ